jgi:hypothetical protein
MSGKKIIRRKNADGKTVHTIRTDFEVNLDDYIHSEDECTGKFNLVKVKKVPVVLNSIGPIVLNDVPMLVCSKCESTFFLPEFEDFIAGIVAFKLITSHKLLNKKQIRFLRIHFEKTQAEVARIVLASDATHYSKMENPTFPGVVMSPSRQIFLKIYYAKQLKIFDEHGRSITDTEKLDENHFVEIKDGFISSKDIEPFLSKCA